MSTIVVYLFLLFTVYLYSYSIGGDSIMLLFFMLLFAPFISMAFFLLIKNKLEIEVHISQDEVEKYGVCTVNLTLKNKTFLPVPFIDIHFFKPDNFTFNEPSSTIFSLGPFETKQLNFNYTALQRGISQIGVKEIIVRDFLNILNSNLTKLTANLLISKGITVVPRLHFIKLTTQILQTSSQMNTHTQSNTLANHVLNLNGEPGYELREFIAGDPLHKIHWKMSAKIDKLMIRKDECSEISKKYLILDPNLNLKSTIKSVKSTFKSLFDKSSTNNELKHFIEHEDKILEALIAICYACISIGKEVQLWLYENFKWTKHLILDKKGVNELQHRLAGYEFLKDSQLDFDERVPLLNIVDGDGTSRNSKSGEVILFTVSLDQIIKNSIDYLTTNRINVDTVCVINEISKNLDGIDEANIQKLLPAEKTWILDKEHDLTELF